MTLVRRSKLRWYGHLLRRNEEVGIRRTLEFEVEGMTERGCPRLEWRTSEERRSESGVTGC